MDTKFTLPSPNFNKNIKEPSNVNLHYLTPCGMTLLPRSKQPPPMYGARGSTVPGKYIKVNQKQDIQKATIVSDAPMPITHHCANCRMELATVQDMRRHLEQHEPCPADDCNFQALSSILEKHIEAKHITGLYKKVRKCWTPEDIAAWRAERCQRFPTAANVELARQAKEQRLKRGERLEASKARFGKREDRRRIQSQKKDRDDLKRAKNKKNLGKASVKQNIPEKFCTKLEKNGKPCLENSDFQIDVCSTFCGTSRMTDYKHVKAKATNEQNALSNMLGMYGTDSEDGDECEHETAVKTYHEVIPEPELREEKIDEVKTRTSNVTESVHKISDTELVDINTYQVNQHEFGSSDEGPSELPIERITETTSAPIQSEHQNNVTINAKHKLNIETAKRRTIKKRISGLNYKRARLVSNQNTMLSKLLAPNIRHERNVLLQCVRFVCSQDFFDNRDISHFSQNTNILKM